MLVRSFKKICIRVTVNPDTIWMVLVNFSPQNCIHRDATGLLFLQLHWILIKNPQVSAKTEPCQGSPTDLSWS